MKVNANSVKNNINLLVPNKQKVFLLHNLWGENNRIKLLI